MKCTNVIFVSVAAVSLAGCGASLPKLPTTGSIFGGTNEMAKENRNPNDPVARAMGVAATSARAIKCGYNFDPAKLKSQYLAYETASAPTLGDKLSNVYDTAFAGVSKAIVTKESEEEYCTPDRTHRIKEALNRNLAGDYTPPASESPEDSGGIFSGWGSNSSGDGEGGAKMKEMMEH